MKLEIDSYDIDYHFASPVFRYSKPEFLNSVRPVFREYINRVSHEKNPNDPYPGIMTELISKDERIEDFLKYVSDISWDVLNKQGYNMDMFYTDASDMWGQFHPQFSSMEKHSHGYGSLLSGFYFLETPDNSSTMYIHDPRAVKVHSDLPMRDSNALTLAHTSVFYNPKPGDLIFTNSWLEHSFSRNASLQPYNFIHIHVRVVSRQNNLCEKDGPVIV
jgi:uncharacterized protein (TIGR02466 family)